MDPSYSGYRDRMSVNKLDRWSEEDIHLPEWMRKDARNVLRAMSKLYDSDIYLGEKSAIIVDGFLWFAALHGRTLQKSRAKVKFKNIDKTLRKILEEHIAKQIISQMKKNGKTTSNNKNGK